MMTDDAFLEVLRLAQRMADDGRQCSVRGAMERLDRATRGRCTDHTQRQALHRVLDSMHRGSVGVLDETIEVLSSYLQQESSTALRQHEKMIRFAESYGADSKTIARLTAETTYKAGIDRVYQELQAQVLAPITKAAIAELMNTMTTKTSIELQAELAAAIQAEEIAAERAARASKLNAYGKLAAATTILLNRMKEPTTAPDALLAQHRGELKALAAEFGYRIVLVGDRTTAVLVQA